MEKELWYQKLKRERKQCGLTQVQLALIVHIIAKKQADAQGSYRPRSKLTPEVAIALEAS